MTEIKLVQGSPEWHKLRKRCQEDLYFFAAKVLGLEDLVPMTLRAHYALCRFAERRTGIPEIDSSRVQLIQVGRGWGKSTCVTKARALQRLVTNREWSVGIANERQDNANAFLASVKMEFETNEFLRALFPECIPDFRKTTWAADRIIINRTKPNPVSPSVLATGAGATVTGVHLDEWIVDDIISQDAAENARSGSYSEIEKTNRWVVRLQPLLKNPKADQITFIGTPWWLGDTYEFVEEMFGRGEDPKEFLWTLKLPNGERQEIVLIQKGELAIFRFKPIQNGKAVFPERLDLETLAKLQQDDPVFYAAQYELNPVAGEVAAFKTEWLRPFEWENRKQIRYDDDSAKTCFERTADLSILMSVDPAISDKSSAARSAITIVGSNGRKLFMLEAWADRVGPSALAAQIIKFYMEYRPARILIESVQFQMALAEILTLMAQERNLGALPIYEFKTGSQQKKVVRIAGLEPFFRKGLIYYHPSQTEFISEYTAFTTVLGNRLVDILDALSMQKESWEHMTFLGDGDRDRRGDWRAGQQTAINRIKSALGRGRRTLEWRRR